VNLWSFGADMAALQALRAQEGREKARLEEESLLAEKEAVEALLAEVAASSKVKALTTIMGTQGQLLRVADERHKKGFLAIQEVEKAQVDLDNFDARLTEAKLGEVEAGAELLRLLGPSRVEAVWPWQTQLDFFKRRLDQKVALQLADVPAYRAARAQLDYESDRMLRSRRALLPAINASVELGYRFGSGMGTGEEFGLAGELSVAIPLFNRLEDLSEAKAQRHRESIARTELELAQDQARQEWEVARQSLDAAVISAEAREKTLAVARKIYQSSLTRFEAGRVTVNELTVEGTRLLDSELYSIQAWKSAHLALLRFCHATGTRISKCLSSKQGGSENGFQPVGFPKDASSPSGG
jgi:outer membrane protein TolC